MRRTHLRGHVNILKRVLVHASGFNLGLVMRRLIGVGTPRGLQGRLRAVIACAASLWCVMTGLAAGHRSPGRGRCQSAAIWSPMLSFAGHLQIGTCTTGC